MHPIPPTKAEIARQARAIAAKPNCAACPFAVDSKPCKPVLGVGGIKSRGIIIVEMPSRDDVESGEAVTGELGQQFDYILATASLPREHMFIVPAIACRPNVDRTKGNLKEATLACRPLLLNQLARFAPDTPVLALGEFAHLGLTGRERKPYMGRGFLRPFKL